MKTPRGFTLVELLVGMVILAVIGAALTKLMLSQSRFYDDQGQLRRARFVARTAVNATLSDLRMVEATGGVVSATPTQVILRVPYAMGLVCNNNIGANQASVAVWPVDSTVYANNAGFSGYAWRDSLGNYTYVETGNGAQANPDAPATCAAANVTILTGGYAVAVKPNLPGSIPAVTAVGTIVFLFQRITYEFKASTAMPGRTALWRTVVQTGQADELVAPFDTSAKFRFFVVGSDTAQSAVPSPLSNMRGLELDFNSQSEHAPSGSAAPEASQLITGVFFNNRVK
jgi:prepilin-type N-terminal cleavage/methylation domain-containing protein